MENVVNIAKINNNLRPMYVKEIIFEHTDETHFISVGEILEILEANYGISSCRKTIYEDIEMLITSGFDIEDVNGKNNRHLYHVLSREFEIAELLVTIGAVKSIRTLPPKKNKRLVEKLSRLAGPSADFLMMNTINEESPKSDNNQVYYIIDIIYHAVVNKKQIAFKYYEMLTSSATELAKKSKVFQVSPYRLICCKEFFYLLGYSNKQEKILAFRVDRINGIPSMLDVDSVPEPDELNSGMYIRDHSQEKEEDVILDFDVSVIDSILNRFGHDLDITCLNKTTCRAKINVKASNGLFAWILGFDGKVSIYGSKEVKDQLVRFVSRAMARL